MTAENIQPLYYELLRDIYRIRKSIFTTVIIFFIGVIFGMAYQDRFSEVMGSFGKIVEDLAPHTGLTLIGLIFLRNSTAAAIAIASGYVFGIFPILASLVNGVIVGVTFSSLDASKRITALLLLLPHGIFELPSMFISWGLGLEKGISVMHSLSRQPRQGLTIRVSRIFFFVVIPLLILAAFVEGTMIEIMKGR